MPISAGTKLGSYEITGPIGAGGMGEVYRARDTKLDRNVAIKVLPEKFAEDAERLARFEREAKLLASLNHPNIASIYGFEDSALVMELVEGPTLADRIQKGPIPVEEALAIAKQIAEALEAGHEAGVIHRDLKPANVKVREDGTVKVLDYGLAKALEGDTPMGADSDMSQSPTLTRQGTQLGVILGTAAYMSPEQAKGKRVDKRTDVWAFGTVVYEMLTGKRAFAGDDVSDTLAAVLRAEPDLEALPPDTPESLRLVLRLCLNKDVKERFQSIGDVRLAMKGAFEVHGATPTTIGWRRSIGMATAAALLFAIVTGVVVWRMTRPAETPPSVIRFSIPFPGNSLFDSPGRVMDLSRDGTRLVYSANDQLYIRAMDQMTATPIRGTEGARNPFFSPDGAWVGFWANGRVMKVAVQGGALVYLCDLDRAHVAWWGEDDTIVFRGGLRDGIVRVSAEGGSPEVLIPLAETGEMYARPQILPGGRAVLFTRARNVTNWEDSAQIVVQSLETGARKVLIERGDDPRYVPTGHLVYVLDGTLLAMPFDSEKLEVMGGPVPIAEDVMNRGSPAAQYSISDAGALVYVPDSNWWSRSLVWLDRDGKEEPLAAEPLRYQGVRISPEGGRVAVHVRERGENDDIWLWDLARETMTRFTIDAGRDAVAVWTPDGRRVAFSSERDGRPNLYWKSADGTGVVERLDESDALRWPNSFSLDGTRLLFGETEGERIGIGALTIDGSSEQLLESEFRVRNAEISPDGRWLSYESDASGRSEIYVRPFPNVEDGRWPISKNGGVQAFWARDSREMFYLAPGRRLMAVAVETELSFTFGKAEELFRLGPYSTGTFSRGFDISPDGERFLMIKDSAGTDSTEFVVVVNWFEELRRLVPTDN